MKKLWKWLFGTRKQQCNIHDVSKSCPCCDGTGYCEGEHYDDLQPCLTCGGSGHVC
jgi:DnaJ-class molecular chaperone